MMRQMISSLCAVALVAGATVWAADEADSKLDKIQCVVAKKQVNPEKSADYKEGKVYFCCDGCSGKFKKDVEKFAKKANMQLVATKQYEQKKCPLSGGDLNPETALKVGDATVAFCCNNCKGKVAAAEGEKQLVMVFSEEAFKKAGFAPKKKSDE